MLLLVNSNYSNILLLKEILEEEIYIEKIDNCDFNCFAFRFNAWSDTFCQQNPPYYSRIAVFSFLAIFRHDSSSNLYLSHLSYPKIGREY